MNNGGKMNNKRIKTVGSGNNMRSSSGGALSLEELTMEYKMTLIMYNKVQSDYINYLKTAYDSSRYTLVGVGTNGQLYHSAGINGGWALVPDGATYLTGICTGNDGKTVIACGYNGQVYTKSSWDSKLYTIIPDPNCCITKVAQGSDGTIVGVGTDHQLYTKAGGIYATAWTHAVNPAQGEWCSAVCIAPDGSVYVIGSYSGRNGFSIWKKPSYKTLSTSLWQYVADQYFIDFTILPDGMMVGVGTDYQVYTYPNYKDITSDHWGKSGGRTTRGKCCVVSVTGVLDIKYTQFEGKKFWGGDSLFDSSVTTGNTKFGNTYSKIPDKDSGGNDYVANGAAIGHANSSVDDCTKTCNAYDDCNGFVMYNNFCYPKTSGMNPNGTGALPGGALYVRQKASINNIQDCQALCSSTLNCSGATFNSTNSTCKLSSGEGSIAKGQTGDTAFMLEGPNLLKKAQQLNGKLTDLNLQITNMTTGGGGSFNESAVHNKGEELRAQLDILRKERNKLDRIVEEKMELDEAEQEGDLITNSNYYSFVLLFTLIIIFIIYLIVLFMPNFSLMQPPSITEIVSGDSVNKNVLYIAFVVVLIAILTFFAKRYESN